MNHTFAFFFVLSPKILGKASQRSYPTQFFKRFFSESRTCHLGLSPKLFCSSTLPNCHRRGCSTYGTTTVRPHRGAISICLESYVRLPLCVIPKHSWQGLIGAASSISNLHLGGLCPIDFVHLHYGLTEELLLHVQNHMFAFL